MRLGDALIRAGHITADQLDEAVRAQVIYGGRIGTNLVELGHVDLDVLAEALGAQYGLVAAVKRHFEEADAALQRRLPAPIARDRGCIPLAVVNETPRLIAVAFLDPPDEAILSEVSRLLGAEIVAAIAPELRLRYQLERVYGIPRPNRYKRVRTGSSPASGRQKPVLPEHEDQRQYVRPITEEFEKPALGKISLKRTYRRAESAAFEATVDYESALRQMRRAHERDKVVDVLLRCVRIGLGHAFGVCAFLVVRDNMAIGWRGYSHFAEADDTIGAIAVPLDHPSVLQLACATQVPICGAPPPHGERVNVRFWQLLGSAQPREVIACPIVVDSTVVGMLYAHSEDLGPIPEEVTHEVIELCRGAAAAFLRLIRSSQR